MKKKKLISMGFFSKNINKSKVGVRSDSDRSLTPKGSEHSVTLTYGPPSLRDSKFAFRSNRSSETGNTSPLASPLTSPRPKNTGLTEPIVKVNQAHLLAETSPPNLEGTTSPKQDYSLTGSASPCHDAADNFCYKTDRLFKRDLPYIALGVSRAVLPGVGLGIGAYGGHALTDAIRLTGPAATGVQATLGTMGAAIGLEVQNSLSQPRTPTGANSHTPGVFTHNAQGLEFEKASRNQTPGINSTKLTYPSTDSDQNSNEGNSQGSFISPLALLHIMQKDSSFGSHVEMEGDLTPLLILLLSITAEMHKEQIKDEVLGIKENVINFIKSKFNLN